MNNVIRRSLILMMILMISMSVSLFANGSSEEYKKGTAGAVVQEFSGKYNKDNVTKYQWVTVDEDGKAVDMGEPFTDGNTPRPPTAKGIKIFHKGEYGPDFAEVHWFSEEETSLSAAMDYIALAIDQITMHIAMAIHPFPNVMFQMYQITVENVDDFASFGMSPRPNSADGSGCIAVPFSTDWLLISNAFYNPQVLEDNKNATDTGGYILPISENPPGTNSQAQDTLQYKKWSIVTVLFITCFAAEIIWSAVYGYITGSNGDSQMGNNLLLTIVQKAAITIVLFVLVASLPFLLESIRMGLFTVARIFYGATADVLLAETGIQNPLPSTGSYELFKLPGYFISSMKDMFTKSTSTYGKNAISEVLSGDNMNSWFKEFIVWFIYLVFRFALFFTMLKGAVHIARNILEVYLLLGLVMIMTPFSVFTPTKKIGANCIMSLLSNLIECFVIMVIILTVLPAVKATIISLLDINKMVGVSSTYYTETYVGNSYDLEYGNSGITYAYDTPPVRLIASPDYVMLTTNVGHLGDRYGIIWNARGGDKMGQSTQKMINHENLTMYCVIRDLDSWDISDLVTLSGNHVDAEYKKNNGVVKVGDSNTLDENLNTLIINDSFASQLRSLGVSGEMWPQIPTEMRIEKMKELSRKLDASQEIAENLHIGMWGNKMRYASMTNADQEDWESFLNNKNAYASNYGNQQDGVKTCFAANDVKMYGIQATGYTQNLLFYLQLTMIFLGMYLPCYFVMQSTQIVNSLMRGDAGMESLGNALGQQMGAITRAGGQLASLAGNVAKGLRSIGVTGAVGGAVKSAAGAASNAVKSAAGTIGSAISKAGDR